ncbi:hypothetical protein AAHE18_12G116800 [Arachis hypogaea]
MLAKAFKLPSLKKASTLHSPISIPLRSSSMTATAVGRAPLMVQPKAPAPRAALLMPSMPGIKGAQQGSTILSEERAFPSAGESPCRTHATKAPAWLQFQTQCGIPISEGRAARIFFGASNSGITTKALKSNDLSFKKPIRK